MRRVYQQLASRGSDPSHKHWDRGECVHLQEGTDREKQAWCGVCFVSHAVTAWLVLVSSAAAERTLTWIQDSYITTDDHAKRIKPTFFFSMGHLGLYKVNNETIVKSDSWESLLYLKYESTPWWSTVRGIMNQIPTFLCVEKFLRLCSHLIMSRRVGHLQGFLCSVLQPTHLVHRKLRFIPLPCLIWAREGPSYQASTASFFVMQAPVAQETTNKEVTLATFSPHQLWGLGNGSSNSTAAAPSCADPVPGAPSKCRSKFQSAFLGPGSGSPPLHPSTCAIITEHEREMLQLCHRKCPGAL